VPDPCFGTTALEEGFAILPVVVYVGRTLDGEGAVMKREVSKDLAGEKLDGDGGVSSFLDRDVIDGDLGTALNVVAEREREISIDLVGKGESAAAVSSFFERDEGDGDLATVLMDVDEGPLERAICRGFVDNKFDSRKGVSSFLDDEVNDGVFPTEVRGVEKLVVDLYAFVSRVEERPKYFTDASSWYVFGAALES